MTSHLDMSRTLVDHGFSLNGRSILLLQGHPSRFWGELGDGLSRAGAQVHKIHFCLADQVFWGRRAGRPYRGSFAKWRGWLERFLKDHGITDIIYYADRFPYHVVAREIGERLGIEAWAVEFGYLRPDWLTFEPGGMGAYSRFDRSFDSLERLSRTATDPDMTVRFRHGFAEEALNEVTFGLLSMIGQPLYPRYRSDRFFWPVFDYLSWIPKLLLGSSNDRRARRVQERLSRNGERYFLLPMQIESDYQIRDNSPYSSLEDFVFEVMESFSRHASDDTRLVIKLHPLDSGMENWHWRCRRLARQHGLQDRVDVIRGGDLGRLINEAKGVVLVNSTVGLHALRRRKPVIALGSAIYDINGLTHRAPLETFWREPSAVQEDILSIFLRALTTIQIKGSFFSGAGRAAAIDGIVKRLSRGIEASQRASVRRLRWRINNPEPMANKNAPSKIGNKIST